LATLRRHLIDSRSFWRRTPVTLTRPSFTGAASIRGSAASMAASAVPLSERPRDSHRSRCEGSLLGIEHARRIEHGARNELRLVVVAHGDVPQRDLHRGDGPGRPDVSPREDLLVEVVRLAGPSLLQELFVGFVRRVLAPLGGQTSQNHWI
jgi:hypothetical protein